MDSEPTRLLCPWDSPGKDTGVGCHALLPTQGWNLSLMSPALAGKFFTTGITSQFHSVLSQVVSDSATPWTAAHQPSLSITNSRNLLKFMSIESVMSYNHLILCCHLHHLQCFPALGSFPMSQFFSSGDQSIGVSAPASVLPMNI